jgi:hypothetical protein
MSIVKKQAGGSACPTKSDALPKVGQAFLPARCVAKDKISR